jgi:hypothetical protein
MEQSPNHPLEETRLRRVPQLERSVSSVGSGL